jgi:RNA polymerase sigma-70 factor (ECF subfamily)
MAIAPVPARPTLAELYRDHFDFVYRVARRLAGRALAAEDVAQEVFLVVARRLDSFEPYAQVTTWLYGITFNVVRALRRRLLLELSYRADEADGLDVPIVSVDVLELREAWNELEAILQTMAPRKRDVFVLAELEELSCAEIAEIVGAKEATVWSRLHYARRELAEKLEKRARKRR